MAIGTISSFASAAKAAANKSSAKSSNNVANKVPSVSKAIDVYNFTKSNAKQLQDSLYGNLEPYMIAAKDAQELANEFNAWEAQNQRDWTEYMSSTAHQREVKDLMAAGLNPVISAYGQGASVGSGAAASSSNQLTGVFGSLAASAIGAVSDLAESLNTNARTYAAEIYQTRVNRQNAVTQANATKYAANKSAWATKYASDNQLKATKYSADLARQTSLDVAQIQKQMNLAMTEMNNLSAQKVAQIAGNYGVQQSKIQQAASKYAADLSYAAALKETDAKTYREKMSTLTHEFSTMLGTTQSNATDILQSLIGVFDFF